MICHLSELPRGHPRWLIARRASLLGQGVKDTGIFYLICQMTTYTVIIMTYSTYVISALILSNLAAFALSLYAQRRVAITDKALKELDWETLANITGEIGSLKRTVQKVNNRVLGMSSNDPHEILNRIPKLQPNVTELPTQQRGG